MNSFCAVNLCLCVTVVWESVIRLIREQSHWWAASPSLRRYGNFTWSATHRPPLIAMETKGRKDRGKKNDWFGFNYWEKNNPHRPLPPPPPTHPPPPQSTRTSPPRKLAVNIYMYFHTNCAPFLMNVTFNQWCLNNQLITLSRSKIMNQTLMYWR